VGEVSQLLLKEHVPAPVEALGHAVRERQFPCHFWLTAKAPPAFAILRRDRQPGGDR